MLSLREHTAVTASTPEALEHSRWLRQSAPLQRQCPARPPRSAQARQQPAPQRSLTLQAPALSPQQGQSLSPVTALEPSAETLHAAVAADPSLWLRRSVQVARQSHAAQQASWTIHLQHALRQSLTRLEQVQSPRLEQSLSPAARPARSARPAAP